LIKYTVLTYLRPLGYAVDAPQVSIRSKLLKQQEQKAKHLVTIAIPHLLKALSSAFVLLP